MDSARPLDPDLRSVQQARDLLRRAHAAQKRFADARQEDVDRVVDAMVEAGAAEAERLGRMAHEETGFGRPESKKEKNLFATRTLGERMRGMKTAGIIRKSEDGSVWEVATPMGVVAALIPSTNPTSTALYKAIIAAKARCGIVMTPHPRAKACTAEALRVVAEAAYRAGAPEGLFGCLTEVTIEGTNALMEHEHTAVILATGGPGMVRAAHSKGKPAYGVGSGNVPVYVDRSADLAKAAADVLTGTSFDWGTLCSTERTLVVDQPVKTRFFEELKRQGGYFCEGEEKEKLRRVVSRGRGLNTEIVGQSPQRIAEMAGFRVPEGTRALLAEVDAVGKGEPLSMETLSPILSVYTADGWQQGCDRCIEVLHFGGIGHTLAVHATSERVIEAFALEKPAMRIVVNTVAALGSVGLTTSLFPAMTLGPGTVGGSITSDNISPLHLLNVKRLAFETHPLNGAAAPLAAAPRQQAKPSRTEPSRPQPAGRSQEARPQEGRGRWMDEVEARLLARAGNAAPSPRPSERPAPRPSERPSPQPSGDGPPTRSATLPLPDAQIDRLIRQFRK
jgi:acetaldehyde dehydrogenase (acetylating)